MSRKQNKSPGSLKNNIWLLRLIWKSTPSYVLLVIVEGIVAGIHEAVGVSYIQTLFDAIGNESAFKTIIRLVATYGIYLLCYWLFHCWYWQKYTPQKREELHSALHCQMLKKAVRFDLSNYEDPDFYNDYIWAMDESAKRADRLLEETSVLISRFISSFALTGILIGINPIAAIIIFITAAIRIGLLYGINKQYLIFAKAVNPVDRRSRYIKRIFRLPDYAIDLRSSSIYEVFLNEYDKNADNRINLLNKYGINKAFRNSLMQIIAIISEVAIILLMLYNVMITSCIGLGGFAAAVNACWKMSWQLQDFVNHLLRYHEHGIFIERIIQFWNNKPTIQDGKIDAPIFASLSLQNVEFSYPNKNKTGNVVNSVSLEINRGDKIAFVGYNGAGKTTLIKLILRLYDTTNGEILYNGNNIKEYTLASLRSHIATVFQDYQIFNCSIAENVVGGLLSSSDDTAINAALAKSTFFSSKRTQELESNTLIGRELYDDGTQLSTGESQKIAIARALYQNAELLILDEPSSALDPDAEYELNKAIAECSDTRTVIFISHRLTSTRHADKIYVFDNGSIIESGTHDELMAINGTYAQMFNLQSSQYLSAQASDEGKY